MRPIHSLSCMCGSVCRNSHNFGSLLLWASKSPDHYNLTKRSKRPIRNFHCTFYSWSVSRSFRTLVSLSRCRKVSRPLRQNNRSIRSIHSLRSNFGFGFHKGRSSGFR